jgi:hypothetical protein
VPSTQLSIVAPGYCPQAFVADAQVGASQAAAVPLLPGEPPPPLDELPPPLDAPAPLAGPPVPVQA